MSSVQIFWDPMGTSVDTLGTDKFLRVTDGDTPYISMSIRLLNLDTPEVHYPGNTKPSAHDANLAQLATWIQNGDAPIDPGLGQYLMPKLTGNAGTLQEHQGLQATQAFQNMLDTKLTLPNGKKRPLFIRAADEHFDQYGRLLAYIAPNYSAEEREKMTRSERATFNLLMVEDGWAASFPIYPSVPGYPDLVLLREAAKDAYDNKKGIWDNPKTLTGYEFRMCIKLCETTKKLVNGEKLYGTKRYEWIERYCVDMTTKEIYFPQDYYKVKPYNRIFIWPKDVIEAVAKMNLAPAP